MDQRTVVGYDELQKIAKVFDQESEAIAQQEGSLRQRANQLESEWIGEGANKFFNEFYQEVLPGLRRVQEACQITSQTIGMVVKIFNEAEEETQGYFKSDELENAGGGTSHGIDVSGLEFGLPGSGGSTINMPPGGIGTEGSGIEVGDLKFDIGEMPPAEGGEAGDFKAEGGETTVPENEPLSETEMEEAPMEQEEPRSDVPTGGGGGGGSTSGGSQGMQGDLNTMGAGSHSQVGGGPGAAEQPVGGQAAPQHTYQSPAGGGNVSGTSAQNAPGMAPPTGGTQGPVRQTGMGEALGAAGMVGGGGAAASAGIKKRRGKSEDKKN